MLLLKKIRGEIVLLKINKDNAKQLFGYWCSIEKSIPFYFPVNYEEWVISMFEDIDGQGELLFDKLETYIALEGSHIKGFIQFGIPNFGLNQKGKNYDLKIGIIRNLYYSELDKNIGEKLIEEAITYFDNKNILNRFAFYHYFGMSCNGRHGKLHNSCIYIEKLLYEYGFSKEHENVYYTKDLSVYEEDQTAKEIKFKYCDISKGQQQYIAFLINDIEIGGAEIHFLPQSNICYLRWIFIKDLFKHKGLGTKCIKKLFYELKKKGFSKFDTDTADNNINAQKFYEKTGFEKKGFTRSYENNHI